jgi:hypothetical protein
MNMLKSRGGVAAIVAALALASVTAFAQAPGGGPPRGPGGGGGGMGGFGGAPDKATTIQRQGLNDPALKLTDAQKAQIDKVVDGYVAEQKTLAEKYPMTQGAQPSAEATAARTKSREDLAAAVGKVLDDSQRKTWEAARAAARGGPGGGAGGPGGRPPGGGGGGPGGPGAGGPPPAR